MLVGFTCSSQGFQGAQTLSYNGVAMTLVTNVLQGGNYRLSVFYLNNPPTGSSYTLSGTGTGLARVGCVSLKGDKGVGANNTATANSVSLTTTQASSLLYFVGSAQSSGGTISSGTGTIRGSAIVGDALNPDVSQFTQTTTTPGSYSMTISDTGGGPGYAMAAFEIKPAKSGGLAILGVG